MLCLQLRQKLAAATGSQTNATSTRIYTRGPDTEATASVALRTEMALTASGVKRTTSKELERSVCLAIVIQLVCTVFCYCFLNGEL